jgi:hypothetical protein
MMHAHTSPVIGVLVLSLLQVHAAGAAQSEVDIRAYVNDTCIVADEPYLLPPASTLDAADQATARPLPLLGIVVGKLAELLINHLIKASADKVRSGAVREDTRYAASKEMNLYRADFQPAPAISLNSKLGCMTIVAAKFAPESTQCAGDYVPKELTRESMRKPQDQWQTSRSDDSIENQLRRANVCVAGKARAVYEARFEFSRDGTAYRLRSAGYRIESLLTTQDKGESRSSFYTLEISQPGASDKHEVLSTAWVNLGTVTAGARRSGAANEPPPWLRVPALSIEARRVYEEQSKLHQEVMGEIEALQRALTRNQRLLAGLEQRAGAATADIAEGLRQERTKVAVQIQTQEAELEAREAEYQDLPQTPLEFMPVTVEVAVTETRSEKKALLELADVMNSNGGQLASAGAAASTGLFERSLDVGGAQTALDPGRELENSRASYFDALVATTSGRPAAPDADASRDLAHAKQRYNAARRALGLELIE